MKKASKHDIINLFRFIDFSIALPEELELEYKEEVYKIQTEKEMAYISTIERLGIEQGIQQGMQQGIQQGMQQGIQQGMQQGIQQGAIKEARKIVEKLLQCGIDIEIIKNATGLTLNEIKKIKEGFRVY